MGPVVVHVWFPMDSRKDDEGFLGSKVRTRDQTRYESDRFCGTAEISATAGLGKH